MLRIFLLLLTVSCLFSCNSRDSTTQSNEVANSPIAIVIHGGAGGILRENISAEHQAAYEAKLQEALNAAYDILENGGEALDAVQAAIVVMENSPLFNAGKGAVYNSEGTQEMDASLMDGKTLNSGAVAGVAHIKNPILAARMVMDSTHHVMLSGKGAEIFVSQHGMPLVDSSYFFDKRRLEQLKNVQLKESKKLDAVATLRGNPFLGDEKFGTVGAVALDQNGNIAAGTSTGGLTNKKFGRIGDSPVIGAGTYAANEVGGISATGTGEYFIRTVAAHEVASLLKYAHKTPQEALHEVIHNQIGGMGAEGGMILLDKDGKVYWDFNSKGMFRGYKNAEKQQIEMFEMK